MSRDVHLVGSIALPDTQTVLATVAEVLGDAITRIPDGETGDRQNWTGWQHDRIVQNPSFESVPPLSYGRYKGLDRVRLRTDADAPALEFERTGYADHAIEAYGVLKDLKEQGKVSQHTRLLVAYPTPLAVLETVVPQDVLEVEPHYSKAMLDDLEVLFDALPHDELAIQFDICHEMAQLENLIESPFDDPLSALSERLANLADVVPDDIEVGYHFCYGSWHDEHFVEPKDAGRMVDLANSAFAQTKRTVDFLHFPVPIERDDEDYFAPFTALRHSDDTQIFLGLIHAEDGVEGAKRRVDAAEKHLVGFGVSAECGLARQTQEAMRGVLELHATVAQAL